MEIRLSPEREGFVRRCVESGLAASPSAVIESALRLMESRTVINDTSRAVAIGFEQALTGRASYVTSDDIKRRAFRREKPE